VKRSSERMLTTHVGSLPRPQAFLDVTPRPGEPAVVDDATWQAALRAAITEAVQQQAEIGVDVISDGEFGKSNWQAYIMERVSGFEGRPVQPHKWSYIGRDLETFADFYKETRPELFRLRTRWVCTAPIEYDDAQIRRDIGNFKAALDGVHIEEAFMPVIAPGSVALEDENLYYANDAAYVQAVADALKHEYHAIIDAGFLLQVDDAILANVHDLLSVDGEANYLRWAESRIEALNYALEGIPPEKVRYHLCWGSWHGPHTSDVPLRTIVNIILKARPGVVVRSGQPAPRARIRGLGGRQATRRQAAAAGGDHASHAGRRTSGRRQDAHPALRDDRGTRERDRQLGLWFRPGHAHAAGPPEHRLGQTRIAGGRRAASDARVVELIDARCSFEFHCAAIPGRAALRRNGTVRGADRRGRVRGSA